MAHHSPAKVVGDAMPDALADACADTASSIPFDAVPNAVLARTLVFDCDGHLVTAAPRSCAWFGEQDTLAPGQHVADVIAGPLDHAARDLVKHLLDTGQPGVVDRRLVSKGYPPIRFQLVPIGAGAAGARQLVVTAIPAPEPSPKP